MKLTIDKAVITDPNHFDRRMFRCFIDGSYGNERAYHSNCERIRDNYHNDKALRAMAINAWCKCMAMDSNCTAGTVQRAMVRVFTGNELDALNAELIDDLRGLVRDEMES